MILPYYLYTTYTYKLYIYYTCTVYIYMTKQTRRIYISLSLLSLSTQVSGAFNTYSSCPELLNCAKMQQSSSLAGPMVFHRSSCWSWSKLMDSPGEKHQFNWLVNGCSVQCPTKIKPLQLHIFIITCV